MKIIINENDIELGKTSAKIIAGYLNDAIKDKGHARIILGTGASQFATLQALIEEDVDWTKVDMFHLDEYIGLDRDHPASFIHYLQTRFVDKVTLRNVYFVDPKDGVDNIMASLQTELWKEPVDVACIGIGENGHIAFNDPIADFDLEDAFKVVELDVGCRQQQLNEGWFPDFESVPTHAITMSVKQIMRAKHLVCGVPFAVKAQAVKDTLENDVTPAIPATIIKEHDSVVLLLDHESMAQVNPEVLEAYL